MNKVKLVQLVLEIKLNKQFFFFLEPAKNQVIMYVDFVTN